MRTNIEFISCDYQGVSMDDWDYAIICSPDVLEEEEYEIVS